MILYSFYKTFCIDTYMLYIYYNYALYFSMSWFSCTTFCLFIFSYCVFIWLIIKNIIIFIFYLNSVLAEHMHSFLKLVYLFVNISYMELNVWIQLGSYLLQVLYLLSNAYILGYSIQQQNPSNLQWLLIHHLWHQLKELLYIVVLLIRHTKTVKETL